MSSIFEHIGNIFTHFHHIASIMMNKFDIDRFDCKIILHYIYLRNSLYQLHLHRSNEILTKLMQRFEKQSHIP